MKRKFLVMVALLAMALVAAPAMAVTITTTVNGQSTSSSADFAFSDGQVVVTLNNLIPNINNVAQAISDFGFVLEDVTAAASLTDSSGMERNVNTDKTYDNLGSAATGWALTSGFDFNTLNPIYSSSYGTPGIGYYLNVLGTPIGPKHLIIGDASASGSYDNAGGSIAGNPAHNPFLFGPVSFTLAIPGVTAETEFQYVTFSYGTTPAPPVPVPPTVLLMGSGLLGLGLVGWRRRK